MSVKLRGTFVAALVCILVAVALVSTRQALASETLPVLVPNTVSCPAGSSEFKVEPVEDGTYSDGTLTVTLDVYDTPEGEVFDFMSNIPVKAVIVKGGPDDGLLYEYDLAVAADSALHAPLNPNSGFYYGLSNVTFCYIVGGPTNTPTATSTATTTPTNTPTNTPTGTPTNMPTNTPTNTPTNMPTNTPTNTPTGTPTNTPTATTTATITATATATTTTTATATGTATATTVPPTATSTGGATSVHLSTFESANEGSNDLWILLSLVGIAGLAGAAWVGARASRR